MLPRLYPAFHLALLALTLALSALRFLRTPPAPRRDRTPPAAVVAVAHARVLGCSRFAWTPQAARRLASADNLRMVLDRARAAPRSRGRLACARAPPLPLDDAPDRVHRPAVSSSRARSTGPGTTSSSSRSTPCAPITSRAYGYARPTTPNLDALAREGARFDAAYCPTPHTSYSITSMMTGKYMRPLLALGLGDDSDTWAGLLRRYGYRTAAFYPPAVFFIDEDRFQALRAPRLGFEYAKEEFADPALRERAGGRRTSRRAPARHAALSLGPLLRAARALRRAPGAPIPGGTSPTSTATTARSPTADDGIGAIVRRCGRARPGAVVIVTADHGEEFGEHGGRYHGTTVYEEQVRVPLVVDGPGRRARAASATVVQTIDLLPTVLSALGIPRPARVRGRDLGPLLAGAGRGSARAATAGFAFAETDDYALVARGRRPRSVCERRVAACALYDRARDPGETHDIAAERARRGPPSCDARCSRDCEREHGRFERGEEAAWPEALRRGIAGDADAAPDVAALLDDANIVDPRASRRGQLRSARTAGRARDAARARAIRTSDAPVRRWCALALVRMGEPTTPLADALLRDPDVAWRQGARPSRSRSVETSEERRSSRPGGATVRASTTRAAMEVLACAREDPGPRRRAGAGRVAGRRPIASLHRRHARRHRRRPRRAMRWPLRSRPSPRSPRRRTKLARFSPSEARRGPRRLAPR